MQDPSAHCVYCNDQVVRARGPFLDSTTGFTVANRPSQNHNVALETECSMCLGDFDVGEMLFMHNTCHHTWHQTCIDQWVDVSVQNAIGPTDVNCGMCRRPIMHLNLPPDHSDICTFVPHVLSENLEDWVAYAGAVIPVPRDELTDVVRQHAQDYPQLVQYLRDIIGVDTDGPYPSAQLGLGPRYAAGSEIFNRVESVQGGAVAIEWCPHITEYFFMYAPTYHDNICALFARNWSPIDGGLAYFQVRHALPPDSLPELLRSTQRFMLRHLDFFGRWNNGDKAVEIFHVQLQSHFPNSIALSGTARLYLRVVRPSGLPEHNAGGDITMGSVDDNGHGNTNDSGHANNNDDGHDVQGHNIQGPNVPQNPWHDDWQVRAVGWSDDNGRCNIYTDAETQALVDALGGVGNDFTLILDQYGIQSTGWLEDYIEDFREITGKFGDPEFVGFENVLPDPDLHDL